MKKEPVSTGYNLKSIILFQTANTIRVPLVPTDRQGGITKRS